MSTISLSQSTTFKGLAMPVTGYSENIMAITKKIFSGDSSADGKASTPIDMSETLALQAYINNHYRVENGVFILRMPQGAEMVFPYLDVPEDTRTPESEQLSQKLAALGISPIVGIADAQLLAQALMSYASSLDHQDSENKQIVILAMVRGHDLVSSRISTTPRLSENSIVEQECFFPLLNTVIDGIFHWPLMSSGQEDGHKQYSEAPGTRESGPENTSGSGSAGPGAFDDFFDAIDESVARGEAKFTEVAQRLSKTLPEEARKLSDALSGTFHRVWEDLTR